MFTVFNEIKKNKYLYVLALPAIIFLIMFAYIPLSSYVLAFKKYRLADGIWGSEWVGFENFKFFFGSRDWIDITVNTLYLNVLFLTFGLTFALLLSIFLNEILLVKVKKIFQSFIFLPYFISWLVISFMVFMVFNSNNGLANEILKMFNLEPVLWYQKAELWPPILTIISIWKNAGYNSIIFLSAITAISSEYYESAKIDGASRVQQTIFITLPLLRNTFLILLLLGIGRIFYGDFGMMYGIIGDNSILFPTTDVIDTYSYRMLRQMGNFSTSSAIVLYQSVMGLVAVIIFNIITKKIDNDARLF